MTWEIRLSDLYLIDKEKLSTALLYIGILIAFLGSLNPWFMWIIGSYYPVIAAPFIVGSFLISYTMSTPIYSRKEFLFPILTLIVFAVYERISMESNLNAFLMLLFRLPLFAVLFMLDAERLKKLMDFLCKVMAIILIPSLFGHLLYLIGFPLPYRNAQFGEFYSFSNYYLFLVSDIDIFKLFPRFISYFLEPSHIGTACAFLLFTQRGEWRKWYNIVLLTTIFFTFSLASYIYLVVIMFFNSWTAGKQVARKFGTVIIFLLLSTIATFTYNNGDNLVHDLIAIRLEMDDGKLSGDNRVTGGFEADFDSFMQSSDIVFGRRFEVTEFGNAGYRVFFYENGIIGIFLLFLFYVVSMMYAPNKRALIGALTVAFLYFWASAFMLWENIYIPLYAAAYLGNTTSSNNSTVTTQ